MNFKYAEPLKSLDQIAALASVHHKTAYYANAFDTDNAPFLAGMVRSRDNTKGLPTYPIGKKGDRYYIAQPGTYGEKEDVMLTVRFKIYAKIWGME